MARKPVELGPTGLTVAQNVVLYRGKKGWTLGQLSERLAQLGHRLTASGISNMENRQRRMDVDDLLAFAAALEISPAALLMPPVDAEDDTSGERGWHRRVRTSAGAPEGPAGLTRIEAGQLWTWLVAEAPLDAPLYPPDPMRDEVWRRGFVPTFAYRTGITDRPSSRAHGWGSQAD